jgi:hypothetical protein
MKPGAFARQPGPATLTNLRLSSNDPPLTMIVELTGAVAFDKTMDSGADGATVKISLHDVTPAQTVGKHIDFNRSIFKDCAIAKDESGTTLTLKTKAVSTYTVIPLDDPPRLLVTFTPASEGKPADAAALSN